MSIRVKERQSIITDILLKDWDTKTKRSRHQSGEIPYKEEDLVLPWEDSVTQNNLKVHDYGLGKPLLSIAQQKTPWPLQEASLLSMSSEKISSKACSVWEWFERMLLLPTGILSTVPFQDTYSVCSELNLCKSQLNDIHQHWWILYCSHIFHYHH